jgi:ferrochelatase
MGGPATLDDVRPFLYNLFSDREIIQLGPSVLQKPLAWLIARRRAPKSRDNYAKIGGGSPLTRITRQQAECLQNALYQQGKEYPVEIGMRYWQPTIDQAIASLLDKNVDGIIGVSLYPHYSRATAGSSINQLKNRLKDLAPNLPLTIIDSWQEQPLYIKALASNIDSARDILQQQLTEIVYSAHSLPVSFIEDGDPYVNHLHQTIRAIEEITGQTGHLAFQSRSGPVEWLSPSTPEMINKLADRGCKNIIMVPISFVSDHIETLYEINILYKEMAAERGVNLIPSASLNTDATFIKALAQLVMEKSQGH